MMSLECSVAWALLKAHEGGSTLPVSVLSASFILQLRTTVTPLLTLGSCSVYKEAV